MLGDVYDDPAQLRDSRSAGDESIPAKGNRHPEVISHRNDLVIL